MAHEIAGLTKCNLCPPGEKRGTFTGPLVTIIGNNPAMLAGNKGDVARLVNYVNELSQHVINKHAKENEAIQYRALEYLSMLRLLNFTTTDSALDEQIRFLRWSTLQQVLPVRLNDARLSEMAEDFAAELYVIRQEASIESYSKGNKDGSEERPLVLERFKKRIAEEMRKLADAYEQPGQFNIQVVETPKVVTP